MVFTLFSCANGLNLLLWRRSIERTKVPRVRLSDLECGGSWVKDSEGDAAEDTAEAVSLFSPEVVRYSVRRSGESNVVSICHPQRPNSDRLFPRVSHQSPSSTPNSPGGLPPQPASH